MGSEMDDYRKMAREVYEILERNRSEQKPHQYSEESVRLTHKLADKVKQKLQAEGKTLVQDPDTGRYTIVRLSKVQEPHRSPYSKQSQVLAQEIAEKAKRNLERNGWTVTRDPESGRYSTKRPSVSALPTLKAPVRRSFWDWLLRR